MTITTLPNDIRVSGVETPIDRPERVRQLINAIWETTHSDLAPDAMLNRLALLSGMACATLGDYARRLEADADPTP